MRTVPEVDRIGGLLPLGPWACVCSPAVTVPSSVAPSRDPSPSPESTAAVRELVSPVHENTTNAQTIDAYVPGDPDEDWVLERDCAAGVTSHAGPALTASEVILPEGLLQKVSGHALGIAEHRASLSEYGQHLKRGILLYGKPGTGKTHTVRYLLSQSAGTTAILLSGGSLARISEAATMARALQPSIVVLEDCDLIAEDRNFGHGPQPLLFEVLDAMDGLDKDADVAFVLTTNRVDMLERALAQRPGRVDLAAEIPLPALGERSTVRK